MTYSSSEGVLRHLSPPHASQPTSYPLPVDREVIIGRDYDCQIVIDSNQYDRVSRHHAAIRPLDPTTATKEWMVYDLDSANGTFINGQRLQGGQVLRSGDRVTLAENGPEFIFEYQPLNKSAPSSQPPNTVPNRGKLDDLVMLKGFRIERSPTRLVIRRDNKIIRGWLLNSLWSFIALVVTFYINILLFLLLLLALPVLALTMLVLALIFPGEVAYTFDLEEEEFTIAKQNLSDRIFKRYRFTQYELSDFTAIRLTRYVYEGTADTYTIHLDRVSGDAVAISSQPSDNRETAQQLLDIIDEFLSSVEAELSGYTKYTSS